ncbi:MAG: NAD(P)-dependent oxidoreductase [Bacteroidia bacterium]
MKGWVLVTGAAGYVGSVLCRQLLAQGYRVRGVDVLLFGDAGIAELRGNPDFELIVGDLCAASVRQLALNDVWAVVHLAAIVGDPACKKFPEAATALMDVASRALFEEAVAAGVERFVFASTCSNYGEMEGDALLDEDSPLRPQSHYARLKVGFEEYLLARMGQCPATISILRFATAYGLSPRMRFDLTVNHFTRDMVLGRELLVFGEHQWRPYCHVEDLAGAASLCLQQDAGVVEGVFNIGDSSENYTKAMIVEEIEHQVPGRLVSYGPQADVDRRNYRVGFEKSTQKLRFVATKLVPDGIQEIKAQLDAGRFEDPFSAIYQNA